MSDTPIPVRYDIPIPEGKVGSGQEKLRQTLRLMKVGGSFEWPNYQHPYAMALSVGVKIKTAKLNGTGYTIWKLSDTPTRLVGTSSKTTSVAPCVGSRRNLPVIQWTTQP